MARRQIKVEFLVAGIVLFVVVGAIGVVVQPVREPDKVLENRFGAVEWNHEQHARMEDIANCQVCHHTDRQGTTEARACSECHQNRGEFDTLIQADLFMEVAAAEYKDDFGPPPRISYHAKCIGCHKAMNQGPVVCRDCHETVTFGSHGMVEWDHRTHSRKLSLDRFSPHPELLAQHDRNCESCHHHDTGAQGDGDYRGCRACHEASLALGQVAATGLTEIGGVKEIEKHRDAKHGECHKCHTEQNPEDDLRSCSDCHLPWRFDAEAGERPNLEQAVHERCRDCHNEDNMAAADAMPLSCDGCHRPDPSWLTSPQLAGVLWSHQRHGLYRNMTCEDCHHQDTPGERHMACSNCHGTGLYDNPPVAKALAKRCLGCHEETKRGPQFWAEMTTAKESTQYYRIDAEEGTIWWDHQGHAIADGFSCKDCHHNTLQDESGQHVTALRARQPWNPTASAIQGCGNCHDREGPRAGSVADGSKAPALLGAFRTVCVECHERLEGGPQGWEAYFAEPVIESQHAPEDNSDSTGESE